MARPILGYWDVRGVAQPIRHILRYVGVDFEDKHYYYGTTPDYVQNSTWIQHKYNLGLHFPNLPYYIDGDLKIAESQAIINHLSRKYDLYGETEEEKIRIDVLNGVFEDVFSAFLSTLMDLEAKKPDFLKSLPSRLKSFSDYLGSRQWFSGESISFIDFKLYELFRTLNKFDEGSVLKYENLNKFMQNFESLPAISSYMKSPGYVHEPIYGRMSPFH